MVTNRKSITAIKRKEVFQEFDHGLNMLWQNQPDASFSDMLDNHHSNIMSKNSDRY